MKPQPGSDEYFMHRAMVLARRAAKLGEVPVGCVIVQDGVIVGSGYNRRETDKSALAHAEIMAIRRACRKLGGWRLWKSTMYVTLEPCPMCAGAILNARIPRVVYGASDPKAGAMGSVYDLFDYPVNHKPQVEKGLCGEECGALLSEFFVQLRNRKSTKKEDGGR